jgi:hypothetical protein
MLGPMGARIIDLLKIMTPSEIDRYMDKPQKEVAADVKKASGGEDFDVMHSHPNSGRKLKRDNNSHDESHSDNGQAEHQAKIIPLNQESSKKLEEIQAKQENLKESREVDEPETEYRESKGEHDLESAGILSAAKIDAIKRKKLKELKAKQDSTTNFIIKQRDKLKQTKLKLIEMEAIKNYNNSSNIEKLNDEIDLENPDEEVCVGAKGILVNKKHY